MAKKDIDKLNSYLNDNKRYDIIYNYIKGQDNKQMMYSEVLSKINLYFKEGVKISCINNIIKLLYMIYKDEKFDFNLLSKGELYFLGKIYKIYTDYITESKIEINESINNKITEISSKVNEQFDAANNPLYKLYFKLEHIEKITNTLNDQISALSKKYRKKTKSKEISVVVEDNILLEMSQVIETINKDLINIEHEALKITVDDDFIKYLDNILDKANCAKGEYKNLLTTIERYKEMCSENTNKEDDKEFEKIVLEKLCTSPCTLDELNHYLKSQKMHMSNDELYKKLNILNNKVNIIDNKHLSLPSYYKVCQPSFETLKTFKIKITDPEKELNLLLISDLHIDNMNEDIYKYLYSTYEYAVKNNINTIINLGDLCSLSNFDMETKSALLEAQHLIDEIILKYPKDDNINNLLMGGNHDKSLFIGGINPIERICSERYDFKNLGYDDAIIDIGNANTSNYIALHHPNQRVGNNLDVLVEVNDIKKLLKKFYNDCPYLSGKNLMDFYGHFHKSLLDTSSGICVVPSLTRDRYINGAWHLKIYFEENMKINYIVLIPIINIDKKLIPSQSIIYQKKLK